MRFDLTTCVWGPWHVAIMGQVMLPTLLAPGNLPALAKRYDVRYRISTTHADKARIEALPVFRTLANTTAVELVVDTDEERPEPIHHVNWYHKAIQDARDSGALCAFVPPDVAWSDGTFDRMGAIMAAGKLGTAMPYVRVISETCLPEMNAMTRASDGSLAIRPGELVRTGMRHLHPLTAAALADGRHGRPSLEMLWRVPGEGLVLRHIVRELFSFDPNRIELTHLWYAGGKVSPRDIHVVTDSDEMFMLSFAPLLKDGPLYLQNHAVTGMDVARSSLHPLNDSPLNDYFPRHRIRLHYGPVTERKWQRVEYSSDGAFKQALVMREVLQAWQALKDAGTCENACRALALALQGTSLARRWPADTNCTAFVPTDQALPALPTDLLSDNASGHLHRWILAHVAAGRVDTIPTDSPLMSLIGTQLAPGPVRRTLAVGRHLLHLVDHRPVAEQRP